MIMLSRTGQINLGGPGSGRRPGESAETPGDHIEATAWHGDQRNIALGKADFKGAGLHQVAESLHRRLVKPGMGDRRMKQVAAAREASKKANAATETPTSVG